MRHDKGDQYDDGRNGGDFKVAHHEEIEKVELYFSFFYHVMPVRC